VQIFPQIEPGQRTDFDVLVHGVSHLFDPHLSNEQRLEPLPYGFDHHEAFGGDTALSRIQQNTGNPLQNGRTFGKTRLPPRAISLMSRFNPFIYLLHGRFIVNL